jgi:hypothetical protein
MPTATLRPIPGRHPAPPQRIGTATPPVYRPQSLAGGSGMASRAVQPQRAPIPAAPSVYRPQPGRSALPGASNRAVPSPKFAHTSYVQRRTAGSGVVQRVCSICNGNEQWTAVGNDQVNGHTPSCPRYVRTFQTVHDQQVSTPGNLQRSHSYRDLGDLGPGLLPNGLFVPSRPVLYRLHRHDNNISGGGPVIHYR